MKKSVQITLILVCSFGFTTLGLWAFTDFAGTNGESKDDLKKSNVSENSAKFPVNKNTGGQPKDYRVNDKSIESSEEKRKNKEPVATEKIFNFSNDDNSEETDSEFPNNKENEEYGEELNVTHQNFGPPKTEKTEHTATTTERTKFVERNCTGALDFGDCYRKAADELYDEIERWNREEEEARDKAQTEKEISAQILKSLLG